MTPEERLETDDNPLAECCCDWGTEGTVLVEMVPNCRVHWSVYRAWSEARSRLPDHL